MQWRQVQRRLPTTLARLPHAREQQWSARDGLHARTRIGRLAIPAPPVVNQRGEQRRQGDELALEGCSCEACQSGFTNTRRLPEHHGMGFA